MFLKRSSHPAFALLLIISLTPSIGTAFSIADVSLIPAGTILPSDNIQLVVGITTPSQNAFLFAPTLLQRVGNVFSVDVFIDDGRILPATDYLEETISLGLLAAGQYEYIIRLTPAYDVNFGVREVTGSFSVVPLPSALLLYIAALISLTRFKTSRTASAIQR